MTPPEKKESTGRHAFLVGAGILLTRLAGLVRQSFINRAFGQSNIADAIAAALRIPNLLQNLLAEGVLSASFIPVYARLLAEEDEEEADRVAGAIFGALALVASVVVLSGVLVTPYLIYAVAPGFSGSKRELTIWLVRILFPGLGLLVLSAWCLGRRRPARFFRKLGSWRRGPGGFTRRRLAGGRGPGLGGENRGRNCRRTRLPGRDFTGWPLAGHDEVWRR